MKVSELPFKYRKIALKMIARAKKDGLGKKWIDYHLKLLRKRQKMIEAIEDEEKTSSENF